MKTMAPFYISVLGTKSGLGVSPGSFSFRRTFNSFEPREPEPSVPAPVFAEKLGDFEPIHWRRRALVSRMQQALSENESERRSLNSSAHCYVGQSLFLARYPAGNMASGLRCFAQVPGLSSLVLRADFCRVTLSDCLPLMLTEHSCGGGNP